MHGGKGGNGTKVVKGRRTRPHWCSVEEEEEEEEEVVLGGGGGGGGGGLYS